MNDAAAVPGLVPRRANLTETVINMLSAQIESGTYAPGAKLPSEQELCRQFGVSRTVVREAVASLRLGGRLYSRQGLGVFVSEPDQQRLSFAVEPGGDARAALHVLELRLAVELEAVTLAATRRTPAALADITRAFDRWNAVEPGDPAATALADYEFHLAIARATNNPQFPRFLEALGQDITLDLRLKHEHAVDTHPKTHAKRIAREHGAILSAISQGDPKAARIALRRHLEESLNRYRRLFGVEAS